MAGKMYSTALITLSGMITTKGNRTVLVHSARASWWKYMGHTLILKLPMALSMIICAVKVSLSKNNEFLNTTLQRSISPNDTWLKDMEMSWERYCANAIRKLRPHYHCDIIGKAGHYESSSGFVETKKFKPQLKYCRAKNACAFVIWKLFCNLMYCFCNLVDIIKVEGHILSFFLKAIFRHCMQVLGWPL